jgi:hypothetical protein
MKFNKKLIVTFLLSFLSINEVICETLEVSFDGSDGSQVNAMPVDKIFRDPVWASGLASGARTINKTLDAWMELIFYRLLDNELIYDINETTQFSTSLKRDVYYASEGNSIIVDRFALGPRFMKGLFDIQKVPLRLSGDISTNVISVYPRADHIWINEDRDVPLWRRMANNWFGILPFLTRILPPSFNPNELYDPMRQLETPFIIPFSAEAAGKMDIGSIRSFSLSGGIYLGLDVLEAYGSKIKGIFGADSKYIAQLPYSIYRTGEHRINVLRKSKDVMWVGVTKASRLGHGLDFSFGKIFIVFSKTFDFWRGASAPIVPVSLDVSKEKIAKEERIYSFDLQYPEAARAYEQAVAGNFVLAHDYYQEYVKTGKEKGVKFQVQAITKEIIDNRSNEKSFFVQRSGGKSATSFSEIELQDEKGKMFFLNAAQNEHEDDWNILVGSQYMNYKAEYQVKVKKNQSDQNPDEDYVVDDKEHEPYSMTMAMNISDRYTNSEEFARYIAKIQEFMKTNLDTMGPKIPLREESKLLEFKQQYALENPATAVEWIRVVPSHLGELKVDASVAYSSEFLAWFEALSEKELWNYLIKIYELDYSVNRLSLTQNAALRLFDWAFLMARYPAHYMNVEVPFFDALLQTAHIIKAHKEIGKSKTIVQKVRAYERLFSAGSLVKLNHLFLQLVDDRGSGGSKSISFGSIPKGDKAGQATEKFRQWNGKTMSSSPVTFDNRYRFARQTLDQFEPSSVKSEKDLGVKINRAIITDEKQDAEGIWVDLFLNEPVVKDAVYVLVRIEQSGQINLGRLVVGEKVIQVTHKRSDINGRTVISLPLIGPQSEVITGLSEKLISLGEDYQASFAISLDEKSWSEKRKIYFGVKNGLLKPPSEPGKGIGD